jgi:hypothetical protein
MTARTFALAAALGLLLTGCATATPPAVDEGVSRDAVLTELGPYPADTVWTPAEHDQALTESLDRYWSQLAQQFPDAVRPAVSVEREIDFSEIDAVQGECIADGGDPIIWPDSETVPQTAVAAELWFTCKSRFPVTPEPPANDAQLGYIYDYLTKFTAPCYEENGSPQPEAPTKEFFVENWPNQKWFPSPAEPEKFNELLAVCPSLDA